MPPKSRYQNHPQQSSFNQHRLQQSQTLSQPQDPWSPARSRSHTDPFFNNSNFDLSPGQNLSAFQPQSFMKSQQVQSRPLMQPVQWNGNWIINNGQLTPTSTSRPHHYRESSSSTLGSPVDPASPYAPSTSNPQVVGDSYDAFDFHQTAVKPLSPEQNLLALQGSPYYANQNTSLMMPNSNEQSRLSGGGDGIVSVPEFHSQGSSRLSMTTAASNDSPSTPPSHEDERQRSGMTSSMDSRLKQHSLLSDRTAHRTSSDQMPKLDRTMTDAYEDELYHNSFPTASAPSASASTRTSATPTSIIEQRLQAATHQHLNGNRLSAGNQSPFRENSAYGKTSPEGDMPKTISPRDVELPYNENAEYENSPLFPPPQQHGQSSATFSQAPSIVQDSFESEDMSLSQQSYGSMATTRRESSSAYSTNSHSTPKQGQFDFTTPTTPSNAQQQLPPHYPSIPRSQRQTSNMSNMSSMSNDFPATLTSMETSSSDYSPEQEIQRPTNTSADTGTYTCTYHGCTLRFETSTKLQRHKRENHRNASLAIGNMGNMGNISGEHRRGMTSTAQKLNSQSGPHRCARINPSTGRPCNSEFSRPYDLTRHEDTIHNAGKQKLRCKHCVEEKTFSRSDALTRHMRVVHPHIATSTGKGRKRLNMD
ncbi:hypothetical protein NHQ30_005932 [Ciborinia camelliae]|nr:hypothetical protein NHQ30_005932 [Ciborinia camelliae]